MDNAPSWATKLVQWGKVAWEWIVEMTPIALQKLGEWGRQLLNWVIANAPDWARKFLDAGRAIVEGLWNGIKEKWSDFTSWFSGVWGSLVDRFKNFFGIHSPSTMFAGYGKDLMAGFAQGIESEDARVVDAWQTIYQGLTTTVSDAAKMASHAWVDAFVATKDPLNDYLKDVKDALATMATGFVTTVHSAVTNMPALPAGYWSTPATTPSTTPVATVPSSPTPNQVYTGGAGTGTAVSFGEKNLGMGLNMLSTLLDTSDTIQDIIDFANKTKSVLTNSGTQPLQGSSAENLALRSLTSGGIDSLSINNLLSSIQTLVRALTQNNSQQAAQEFNIMMAPDATLEQRQELEELVSYLNALYG